MLPVGVRAAPAASLEVVGANSLGGRGMNAALAIAGTCAYVGSRNDAAPEVVDISNPAAPRVSGSLPAHPGSTPRELRAVPAAHELVVMFYAVSGGPNVLDIFRWGDDCRSLTGIGQYSFGGRAPHEFYLWQDPGRPGRVLLYVAMFGAPGDGLEVVDVSDGAHPTRLGGLTIPAAYGHAPVHSVSLSADGATAYISLWTGGLAVADVSDFAAARQAPTVRLLTSPGGVYRTPPGDVHSAVPVPGTSLVVTTDERYPAPYGQGCPFGPGHLVDVSNPARPIARAVLAVPENVPAVCSGAPRGTWTSHNPTVAAHLAIVSWYSAGLEVFQLDDPTNPVRVAELRPSAVNPAARDLQLGVTNTMTWSYPVVDRGLVYVADINEGLLVLRYHGPHEQELAAVGFAEGNSNIVDAAVGATASPSPSSAAPTGSPSTAPGATATPSAAPISPRRAALLLPAVAVGLVAAIAVGLGIFLARRRHPG